MSLITLHDKAVLAARFERDPALHMMELGDLDDLLWPHTTWYALAGGEGPVALVYGVGEIPTVLGFARPRQAGALEELLRAMLPVLPRRFTAHLTGGAGGVLSAAYTVEHRDALVRMALTDPDAASAHPHGGWLPRTLDSGDLAEVLALFAAAYPGNWFDERMLATGRYTGVRDADGVLTAVAGVHVYSPAHRVAVVGNVATLPSARGRGAAGACVAQLCRLLREDGVDRIGLNVHAHHATARGLYERLGFAVSEAFEEAVFSAR
ncbi:GNAT family N-acetyltransferase [Kitasatospora sp. NPDC052868]|uniref:GNAT family N-acetyltransferase n=1 Tax=Kitasatospora sp. NPDC052868 TaxID=3364060 RepID=UPI0037C7754A